MINAAGIHVPSDVHVSSYFHCVKAIFTTVAVQLFLLSLKLVTATSREVR